MLFNPPMMINKRLSLIANIALDGQAHPTILAFKVYSKIINYCLSRESSQKKVHCKMALETFITNKSMIV
jgi:hypothetical protein